MSKAIRLFDKGTTLFDGSSIASGYQFFQYQAGTSTKVDTYTDATKGTANSNPMTLNSDGRLDQDVYIDQSVKIVLASVVAGDPPTSNVFTIDNALASEQVWQTLAKANHYTVLETDRDKIITVDASGGEVSITLLAAATAGDGFRLCIKKTDSSINAVVVDGSGVETIDSSASYSLYNQNDSIDIITDGISWYIMSTELGDVHGAAASTLELDKATTITSGSFTVASGDVNITSGDAVLTSGDVLMSQGVISQIDEDARTSSVAYPLILDVQTSGIPEAGIGTGIEFRAESADESNSAFGRLSFEADDIDAGVEATYLAIQSRAVGASLANAYEFKNTGSAQFVFTGTPTAERTITLPDSDVTLGITSAATQAEMETATDTSVAVTPGVTHYHPGVAKAWLNVTVGSPDTIDASYNITSITDGGSGSLTITFDTDFSSTSYTMVGTTRRSTAGSTASTAFAEGNTARTVTATTGISVKADTGSATDPAGYNIAFFGDQ